MSFKRWKINDKALENILENLSDLLDIDTSVKNYWILYSHTDTPPHF